MDISTRNCVQRFGGTLEKPKMAQYTFQEQLLSVMEILAKAATEEINRRVADSCAVIRIELSRSQRDIDSLKRKCQVMENELKKVRGRGRRKGTKQFLSFTNKFDHSCGKHLLCLYHEYLVLQI